MKKQKIIFALLLSFSFMSFPFQTTAHPGSTDDYGGHYDQSDGSYHYHHGYPAHSHADGICPYSYDDQTRTGSGSGGGSSTKYTSEQLEEIKRYTYEKYGSHLVAVLDGYVHLLNCPKLGTGFSYIQLNHVQTDIKPCDICKPLTNTEYIPETSENVSETTEKSIQWWHEIIIIVLCVIFLYVFFDIILSIIDWIIESKKQKEEKYMLSLAEKSMYDHYFACYSFLNPSDFCKMPKGTYIKDSMPCTHGGGIYGKYTVYITLTGNCYHEKESCIHSGNFKKTNIAIVQDTHRPCSKCCKSNFDLYWYKEYRRISYIKKKYNIP